MHPLHLRPSLIQPSPSLLETGDGGIRKRRSTLHPAQIDSTDAQQNTLVIWKHVPAALHLTYFQLFAHSYFWALHVCPWGCFQEFDICSMRKTTTYWVGVSRADESLSKQLPFLKPRPHQPATTADQQNLILFNCKNGGKLHIESHIPEITDGKQQWRKKTEMKWKCRLYFLKRLFF